MSVNTLKILLFIILVIVIVSFMQVWKNNNSILFAVIGIIGLLIGLFLKRMLNQKKD